MDTPKDLKRKADHDERSSQSERKRKRKDGKSGNRPKHYPLSERQQLALLMQMTAEEKNEQTQTPPPGAKKPSGGSGRKDKVNKRNERGETSLHIATIRGELPMIMDLVKQGADVNVQDYAGWTPLHEACNHGFLDIAKFLLEAGAIVNSKGFHDDYPLHDAVMNEHTDLVELLLKHGANPLLANKQGERPLDLTENDEIKQLMQNEILLSDDSDQNDAKSDDKNNRSTSKEKQSAATSSISRELFKQFDAANFDKIVSSDSDDSDDLPLSRQRRISMQSKSSSSSNQATEPKSSTSGFLGSKRKKLENKRRLFSTESSESVDSESKPLKQKYSEYDSLKHILSSEDEFFSHGSRAREDRFSTDSIKSLSDKKLSTGLKRPTVSVSNAKSGEADVYDFSPNADDFSNESNAISLKSESKVSTKWENQSKQPSLYSRKNSSNFSSSKSYDYGSKKSRKPSKDTTDSTNETTALIKPVHETSEMLFDRIFKSPLMQEDDSFSFDTKPKKPIVEPNLNEQDLSSISTTSSSFSPSTGDSNTATSNTVRSTEYASENLFSTTLLSPSSNFSTETKDSVNSLKSDRHSDSQPNIFKQVFEKEIGSRSLSIDDASLISSRESSTRSILDEIESSALKTSRATSLDGKEKIKKTIDEIKVQKSDSPENKVIKKVKMENKDKISKVLSDPAKKVPAKSQLKESKSLLVSKKSQPDKPKLTKSVSTKKEPKSEKKLTLVPDTKSSFLSDLNKTSLLRNQEKIKKKKLAEKKKVTKATTSGKVEEKKTVKKTEVKLIETDSWLGSVSDKPPVEKQRRPLQRSTKKASDASSDSDKTLATTSADVDSVSKVRPSISSVSKPPMLGSNPSISFEDSGNKTFNQPLDPSGLPFQPTPPFMKGSEDLPHSTSNFPPTQQQLSSPIKSSPSDEARRSSIDDAFSVPKLDPNLLRLGPGLNDEHPPMPVVGTDHLEEPVPAQPDQLLGKNDPDDIVCDEKPPDSTEDSSTAKEEEKDAVIVEKEPSEQEKMLQLYIQQRLASDKIELSHIEPLRDRIPMHVLNSRQKDPAVDKLNVIEERLAIQKKIVEKRKKIALVIPQAPQYYWEYMTFTGGYRLSGSSDSRLSVPVVAPPPSLCQPMTQLFKAHEEKRVRLRVQHAIQREKLTISCEQEIMRVHSRAARTNQNQQTPFSACAMLMDCEVYTMPRQSNENETGKTSIRDRFNTRMYLSWLQDVDDKFVKIKAALLTRQRHEAEALHAVQKTEWILKCQEIDRAHRTLKPEEINEIYVPKVNIADDFDLLPA